MVLRAWIEGADWVKGLATLIAALAAHFIDFEAHPEWLGFAKIAFAASAVLVALVLLFVYARLMLARDHARIKVTVNAGLPTSREMTYREYDVGQFVDWASFYVAAYVAASVAFFLKGYTPALLWAPICLPVSLFSHELLWVYVLCQKDAKAYRRPWEEHRMTWAKTFKALKQDLKEQMGKGGFRSRKNKREENRVTRRTAGRKI